KFPAKVVGTDSQTDIALIKIDAKDLPTIPFGDSEKLKVGEWVLAIGNPFNLTSTVTAGIVSAKGRGSISGRGTRGGIESFIQTDAAVNPGNSGGALVNTKGELVGINTAIYSETGNFAGYSFAVPVSIAGKVVADLKQYGIVQRAILGVMMSDVQQVKEEEKEKLKVTEGAYIAEFAPYSSAKEAGVETGDVIVAVNGVKIRTGSALQEQISKYRPGDKVKVTVDRYGKELTFNIELRNAQGNTEVVKGKGDVAEVLGAAFKELTDEQKRQLGISYGVEVTGVVDGKMKDAGITKGYIIQSVNDRRVSTPEELNEIVERVIKSGETDQALFIRGIYPNKNNTGFKAVYYAINLAD
ncbi:MAG: trypsin-like peptidase domain-containing protein, partial [Tannerellaceae bacterium]|nr:trypsin-like peptidase domain-containing protein [Tannerellaceae bacterium]